MPNTPDKDRLHYGKDQAKMFAGIAILLMVFHHFFGFPERYKEGIAYLSILGNLNITAGSIEYHLAHYCKMCVAIFAFNTGYAIWSSPTSYSYRNIIPKAIKFILSYWVVCFLYIGYGYIAKETLPTPTQFAYNLIGLKSSLDFVNVTDAWYVPFYITILFISPLLIKLYQPRSIAIHLLTSLVLIVTTTLLASHIPEEAYILNEVFGFLAAYLSSVLAGILTCKYDLLNALDSLFGQKSIPFYLILICCTILVRPLFSPLDANRDAILVVIFIYSTLSIIRALHSTKVKQVLLFFGKHSMNMWFMQALFYAGRLDYLQRILFYPQYAIPIYVWCLCWLVVLSMGCSFLQNRVFKIPQLFR